MPLLVFARPVQLPQRALETLNLALIIDLLPLGEFERFEHFLHLIERVLEFLDDSVHLLDGVADRRRLMRGFGLLTLLGLFDGGLGRFGGGGHGRFTRRRQGTAWLAPPGMAAATASGATPARAGGCSGLFGRAFI
jgi:hypothetical protein